MFLSSEEFATRGGTARGLLFSSADERSQTALTEPAVDVICSTFAIHP
jgi:hypothetical protein